MKKIASVFALFLLLGCTNTIDLTNEQKSALIYSFISQVGFSDSSVNVTGDEVMVEYELPSTVEEKASWFAIAGSAAAVTPQSEVIILEQYEEDSFKKKVELEMRDVLDVINGLKEAEDLEFNITSSSENLAATLAGILSLSTKQKVNLTTMISPIIKPITIQPILIPLTINNEMLQTIVNEMNVSDADPSKITDIISNFSDVKEYEDELEGYGDMSELSSLQLQEAMQKKQQLIQMLSNIMKSMHETQSAIIRNLK